MTHDELEAAARRVYAAQPTYVQIETTHNRYRTGDLLHSINKRSSTEWKTESWEETGENSRNHCRRIAAAALNVEEPPHG